VGRAEKGALEVLREVMDLLIGRRVSWGYGSMQVDAV
jgi:hypothetical protein